MAQPSAQLQLASGNATEYFYYAQGTGIYDARNNAMLTKTGTGAVTTEGGANVATSNGTTRYTLSSTVTVAAPFTILWKGRTDAGAGNSSMMFGNSGSPYSFWWHDRGGVTQFRVESSTPTTYSFTNTTPSTMSQYAMTVASNGAYAIYRDNGSTPVATGTIAGTSQTFRLAEILDGYDATDFVAKGAIEYLNIVPSVLSTTDITSRFSNPYQVLASAGPSTSFTATTANAVGSLSSKPEPRTAISSTTANAVGAMTTGVGSPATTITATTSNAVGSMATTGSTSNGTFTSEVLKDYMGTVLANKALNFFRLYNDTTGALVLNKTGLSTNASGIVSFSDAALTAGQIYRPDWETVDGSRRMPRKAAT